jgi:hypothetical protein
MLLWGKNRQKDRIINNLEYAILTSMKAHRQHGIGSAEDDFWKTRIPFFTAQFPTYYTKHQKVWGKFHISDERYFNGSHGIIPLTQRTGHRTYIMMHPYVLEPKLTLTISLYTTPTPLACIPHRHHWPVYHTETIRRPRKCHWRNSWNGKKRRISRNARWQCASLVLS